MGFELFAACASTVVSFAALPKKQSGHMVNPCERVHTKSKQRTLQATRNTENAGVIRHDICC